MPEKKRNPIREQDGFTLLEVIVAISILTFGLLAVASMQVSAIRGNYNASNITEATTFGQDAMEQFLAQAYSDADTGTVVGPTPVAGTIYNITRTVAANPNGGQRITVDVRWTDKGVNKVSSIVCIKPDI